MGDEGVTLVEPFRQPKDESRMLGPNLSKAFRRCVVSCYNVSMNSLYLTSSLLTCVFRFAATFGKENPGEMVVEQTNNVDGAKLATRASCFFAFGGMFLIMLDRGM